MATTSKGIYYPTSSDQITPLETVLAGISQSVDSAIPLSGSQSISFTGTTAGASQSVTISFGTTLSAAPQRIQVTIRGPISGSSSYVGTVTNSTTTGFTVIIHRLNAGVSQTINAVWSVMN